MDKTDEVYQSAVSLPPVERARLVERILSSFGNPEREEIDRLWAAEAEARIDAFDRGEITARPAEDVFHDIEKAQ